jgi:hypothetical protein
LDVPVYPDHTNGIISVTIHQAIDLEIGDPEVLPTAEEFKHLYSPNKVVSPYAILYVNDDKAFQTKTKLRNPSPSLINSSIDTYLFLFNSIGTISLDILLETLIQPIFVSLKTSVNLERDPVLDIKSLSFKDLFEGQENKFRKVQQWVPLGNGISFGKILFSIKYKPVKITLPRELQGSDMYKLRLSVIVTFIHVSNRFVHRC